jgi:hypothetical protein
LALISVKKERLGGFEPWSAGWEGRELPLSYNMISIPLVYVIHLINILMVHHPHLNLQNKKGAPMGFEPWSPQATTNGPLFLPLINVKKRATRGI